MRDLTEMVEIWVVHYQILWLPPEVTGNLNRYVYLFQEINKQIDSNWELYQVRNTQMFFSKSNGLCNRNILQNSGDVTHSSDTSKLIILFGVTATPESDDSQHFLVGVLHFLNV